MQPPRSLSLLLIFVPLTLAFVVPRSLQDGMYKAYLDANNNQIIEPLTPELMRLDAAALIAANLTRDTNPLFDSPQTPDDIPPPTDLSRRQTPTNPKTKRRSYCDCHHNSDHSDTVDATQMIRDMINGLPEKTAYVPIGTGYFQKKESVIAYICTLKRNSAVTPITVETYNYALEFLEKYCGAFVPGSYVHGDMSNKHGTLAGAAEYCGFWNTEKWSEAHICQHVEDPHADNCPNRGG